MDFLPVCLKVESLACLIVGGGNVALRKAELLARAGAGIQVVAPEVHEELARLAEARGGEVRRRAWQPEDLQGMELVVAATNDPKVNQAVYEQSREAGLLVNVVDQPQWCNFILPAVLERSPMLVAVSSCGRSPALTRHLRARLEAMIPSGYSQLAELLGELREEVQQRIATARERRDFWERAIQGPATELALAGHREQAREWLLSQLRSPELKNRPRGEVYLVGAGPGDPSLLTFRALQLMQQADVVIHDRLVSDAVLDLVRPDATRIYAGKARDHHSMSQKAINQLLIEHAGQGRRTLRLKGGDPFIFGRGGEEIEELAEHGIPFQVVPGITAANGCACYAGIPLTHRDHAHSVAFLPGNLHGEGPELDWAHLQDAYQTLVFYMSLKGLELACRRLVEHGRDPQTPAAFIEKGTTSHQRTVSGNLSDLPGRVQQEQGGAPSLLIVGEVVRLRNQLAWYEEQLEVGTLRQAHEHS